MPRIVSEQYPKGLGHSVPELGLDGEPVIEKTVFSAVRADGFGLNGRDQVVICGIETHVCVSQTAHDLLQRGIEVHVPADAVGSRHERDYRWGLERLDRAGAVVSDRRVGPLRAARPRRDAGVQASAGADQVSRARLRPARGRHPLRRRRCGAEGHAVGEVVFTTGMSGYQESMTDPSFAGQLITFTYPHIGNYGASAEAMESERPWARAAIMRDARNSEDAPSAERGWLDWLADCGVQAISGIDTRALVRHIRDAGAMRGGVFPGSIAPDSARALIAAEPLDGRPGPRARRHAAGREQPRPR